ncbi:hypothetical protein FNH22_18505 [Fulvivirga sp. M361]|uniref:hypothetical protein n=1 Tax=Fulvivirga sp. M361 TaxID=2594266 RepID=UPI00117B0966|nr:hypothetical protein [Fulvivirga sp. M361]TRX55617.1 hypothetical protein FNH22_18505 [Fulvivirga sp. M361]
MTPVANQTNIYEINKWLYFLTLCVATLTLLVVKKNLVENEIMAFEILEERGQMGFFHLISTLQYASIPLIYLYKFTVVAFLLWIGSFMFGYKVSFSATWHVAAVSESIFLVAEFLKICWFIFFGSEATIFDIRAFYPFSLMNLFDRSVLDTKWIYPLKSLNIFEVIYWFLLVHGINYMAKKKRSVAYFIVFSFYVFFFFIWLGYYVLIYK